MAYPLPSDPNSTGMPRLCGLTNNGYDEVRLIALAPKTNTLYYVAFVDRGETRRIISLRHATRSEVTHYVENL
jgi:uncharacterized DUF497 family protein